MARILLAVDLSYQCYRAAAAHPMLTSRRIFTGGLYGFFVTLAKMVRETGATDVAFCQDIKPYRRSLVYPEYKQLRKATANEELLKASKQSMMLILEVLDGLGFTPWGVPGFESDDLIGHCVTRSRHRFDKIYAASNDSDLYQLLWVDNFNIYTKDIADVMTGSRLMTKFGLTPEQFMLTTALTGTHNDIGGIVGVGPKTAAKAVLDPILMRKWRELHGDLIERNLGLIKLPHPDFPRGSHIPTGMERFNERQLYKLLGRYDIDTTDAMVRAFRQLEVR